MRARTLRIPVYARSTLERKGVLPFGELEALARTLLPVLLSLMCASIARQQSEPLQFPSELRIKFNESAGDAEARRPSLSAQPAAIGEDHDVEPVRGFGREQRLPHISASRLVHEIMFETAVVNSNLPFSRPQKNARGSGLSPPGS